MVTCEEFAAQISILRGQVAMLQSELHNPNHACEEKGLTGAQCQLFLKSLGTQIQAAEAEIATIQQQWLAQGCVAQTTFSTFTGTATLETDSDFSQAATGPFIEHIPPAPNNTLPFAFTGLPDSVQEVSVTSVPKISPTFDTHLDGIGQLTIGIEPKDPRVPGTFDPANGLLMKPVTLQFRTNFHLVSEGDQDVTGDFIFTTGSVTARGPFHPQDTPWDWKHTGTLKLVGTAQLQGSSIAILGGTNCQIVLEGTLPTPQT